MRMAMSNAFNALVISIQLLLVG